jgi:hypothetical protein
MKKLYILPFVCFFAFLSAYSQTYFPKKVCNVNGDPIDEETLAGHSVPVSSSSNLLSYLQRIKVAFGQPDAKYFLRNISNYNVAAAYYQPIPFKTGVERTITIDIAYYDTKLATAEERQVGYTWIIAHEFWHHVNGDMDMSDDDIEFNNMAKELLADRKAGYAVGKLTDVDISFFDKLLPKILTSKENTPYHPAVEWRILAAKAGWLEAKAEGWQNDVTYTLNGRGYRKILFSNGQIEVGEFDGSTYNGFLVSYYPSGDIIIGTAKNGIWEGNGFCLFKDGAADFSSVYLGGWSNGKPNCNRCNYYWNSGHKYIGSWSAGLRNGGGTLYFYKLAADLGDLYEGNWVNDKMEGKGIYYYSNGERYEGELKSDKVNGTGTYFYADGSKYIGEWKDGNRHGKGILIKGSIVLNDGCWRDNEYVGTSCN